MPLPISISGVTKTFPASGAGGGGARGRAAGAHRALDEVSLEIGAGAMFFLLGPSGCGKTTLLRILAGFIEPDAGGVRFGGRDVTRLAPEKRNAAMVFQSYALWPHLSVEQNVEFGLRTRKVQRDERRRRVGEALAMVHMQDLARRKPAALSGGQQQRVALARALVVNPDVLLLDEPLSNLDARLRHEMRDEIGRVVRAAGLTAVYVTHDQAEALSMADHIAVMRDGRVLQVAPPREAYERPNSPAVADILGPTNYLTNTNQMVASAAGQARIMVRPEAVKALGPAERVPADWPAVGASIESTAFLGATQEIICRTVAGDRVRASAPVGARHKAGDRVTLTFDPACAVSFAG